MTAVMVTERAFWLIVAAVVVALVCWEVLREPLTVRAAREWNLDKDEEERDDHAAA